ncbi:hypothetical protein Tco_0150074 [Tanacetum coccineum]
MMTQFGYGITHWVGLGRNSTSINTVSPLMVKRQDRRCEFLSSGLKLSTRSTGTFHKIGCSWTLLQRDYPIVPKPRAVVYRDRNDLRKLMRLNELHKFSDGDIDKSTGKWTTWVKDFHLVRYNKGCRLGMWSEDDKRRKQRLITAMRKRTTVSEGSIESSRKLCWRKNKRY